MPTFFRATIKSLRSDEDLETVLSLRVPATEYDKTTSVGKRVKEVLVVGVFSEDEFLALEQEELP